MTTNNNTNGAASNYTREDAIIANQGAKRYITEQYILTDDLLDHTDQPFCDEDWNSDVPAIAELLRGDLCTAEHGESLESYLERVYFTEDALGENTDVDQEGDIYAITEVDAHGETGRTFYYFEGHEPAAYDTIEEALDPDNITSYQGRRDVLETWTEEEESPRLIEINDGRRTLDGFVGFQDMDQLKDFAERHGLDITAISYDPARQWNTDTRFYQDSLSYDYTKGIDLVHSAIDGDLIEDKRSVRESDLREIFGDAFPADGEEFADEVMKQINNLESGKALQISLTEKQFEVIDRYTTSVDDFQLAAVMY